MLGAEVVEAVFEDWRSAPVRPEVRAMLGFLETMTLHPETLDTGAAAALAEAGIDRQAADDAVMVAVLFNMIDRVADSLGFEIPTPEAFEKSAQFLLKRGYA